ncbi:uncharacterized protein LOC141610615 [Silene latifolia]|uniref:uncharacterized protein LOC141610615 n=1 Tax=Silene latifolia TaxID=37657 RepID=UPI003D77A675
MALTSQILSTKLRPSHNTITLFSNFSSKSHFHHINSIKFKPKTRFNLLCSNNKQQLQILEGFSLLETEPPWESSNVWSTMALYFFSLHVPLSFGGLSLIANLLHQPVLDPQLKAVAILVIGTSELSAAVLLLQFTAKPEYKSLNFLECRNVRRDRNWVFSAILGFAVLVATMYLTSSLADRFIGNEDASTQTVKEILSSGSIGQTSITLVYCIVAPFLEEIVYRRFLLASLAPSMKWHQALVVSSVVFTAAHLSGENFIQLFLIGMVLGCSYSWTGDLRSSILLHSMYNALTLLIHFYT